jgi:hypothetical protein
MLMLFAEPQNPTSFAPPVSVTMTCPALTRPPTPADGTS